MPTGHPSEKVSLLKVRVGSSQLGRAGGVDQRETLQGGSSQAGQGRTGSCYACGKVGHFCPDAKTNWA